MYEVCKKNNINYNKFHQRVIRHKWTIKQALELEKPPKREAHNSIHIKFKGINYKSRRQLCDNYNIDEKLVSLRLRRGWELPEALGIKIREKNIQLLDKNRKEKKGYIYLITNILNKKKYVGITINDIKDRYAQHIFQAKKTSNIKSIEYAMFRNSKDNFKLELLKVCSISQLRDEEIKLIKKYNTRVPEGYNMNSGGTGGAIVSAKILYNKILYNSYEDLAKDYGLKGSTLTARLRKGMNLKEAMTKSFRRSGEVQYNFKTYKNIAELARKNDLKPNTIHSRLSKTNQKLHEIIDELLNIKR